MENRYWSPDIFTVFVAPLYLQVLHGNCLHLRGEAREQFVERAVNRLGIMSDDVVGYLLSRAWREAIVGSFYAGVLRSSSHLDMIGRLLVKSPYVYAGQGHCFALARIADAKAAGYLVQYLETWLVRPDCRYQQDWALVALQCVDEARGTNESAVFLKPGGLWETFLRASGGGWDLVSLKRKMRGLLELGDELMERKAESDRRSLPLLKLREPPSALERFLMRAQTWVVKMLYKASGGSASRFFPWILRIARAKPLGKYIASHEAWCRREAFGRRSLR